MTAIIVIQQVDDYSVSVLSMEGISNPSISEFRCMCASCVLLRIDLRLKREAHIFLIDWSKLKIIVSWHRDCLDRSSSCLIISPYSDILSSLAPIYHIMLCCTIGDTADSHTAWCETTFSHLSVYPWSIS